MSCLYDTDTWKVIPDTDNRYEVCDRGLIRRVFFKKDGSVRTKRNLHPIKNSGAFRVWIKRYGKRAYFCVHRLVAEAFIPGFDLFNLRQRVKHVDKNMANNCVLNLMIISKK